MKHTPTPWHSDESAFSIWSPDGQMRICDIRGWGYLTGKGHGALGLSDSEAEEIQRANADLIVTACNSYDFQTRLVVACEKLIEVKQDAENDTCYSLNEGIHQQLIANAFKNLEDLISQQS